MVHATIDRLSQGVLVSTSSPGEATSLTLDPPTLAGAALALFVALLGSSVLSTFIRGRFTRGSERVQVRRNAAKKALKALGSAQATVNRLSDAPLSLTGSDQRELADRAIELEALIALSGDITLVKAARDYRKTSELFIAGALGTNASVQRDRFDRLIDLITDFIR